MASKQEIISRICLKLRIREHQVSSGSSESREFLIDVADQIGLLHLVENLDKPGIAKVIVESFGEKWLPAHESSGSTVTKLGLLAIERTVNRINGEVS